MLFPIIGTAIHCVNQVWSSLMLLMRIGAHGAEKPVVRLDDQTYVDVSDVVEDFNEAFFASGGLASLRTFVDERVAAGARCQIFR